MKPVRPCIVRDCPNLTYGTRCQLHEAEHRKHRPGQRGTSWAWKVARSKALKRDGYACTQCGSTEFLQVHHVDRNHRNNRQSNLRTLCRDCHAGVHA